MLGEYQTSLITGSKIMILVRERKYGL